MDKQDHVPVILQTPQRITLRTSETTWAVGRRSSGHLSRATSDPSSEQPKVCTHWLRRHWIPPGPVMGTHAPQVRRPDQTLLPRLVSAAEVLSRPDVRTTHHGSSLLIGSDTVPGEWRKLDARHQLKSRATTLVAQSFSQRPHLCTTCA